MSLVHDVRTTSLCMMADGPGLTSKAVSKSCRLVGLAGLL